ncbi:hypothetical protein AVEN_204749-1 [Araneus ventricosus]|uniref:Uncharacterized protein n=1 Tax=Araneus ventricosus TaxID=182803 RepID=A0A4Y2QBS9_ARAVE|nr:hypothetical protein AVEN_204749-1 [Araneus ventricosus]
MDLLKVKPYIVAKCPSAGVVRKLGEGAPVQVSPSSSDGGSKLRGQSQTPRVVSKRDVIITKLYLLSEGRIKFNIALPYVYTADSNCRHLMMVSMMMPMMEMISMVMVMMFMTVVVRGDHVGNGHDVHDDGCSGFSSTTSC